MHIIVILYEWRMTLISLKKTKIIHAFRTNCCPSIWKSTIKMKFTKTQRKLLALFYWHQNSRCKMFRYKLISLGKVNVFFFIKTNKITLNFNKNLQILSVSIKQNKISLTKEIKCKNVSSQQNICHKIFYKIQKLAKKHTYKFFCKVNKLYTKLLVNKRGKNYNFCNLKNNTVMNSHFFFLQIFHHQ